MKKYKIPSDKINKMSTGEISFILKHKETLEQHSADELIQMKTAILSRKRTLVATKLTSMKNKRDQRMKAKK